MLVTRRLQSFGFALHPSRTFDISVSAVSHNAKQIPKIPQSKCSIFSLKEFRNKIRINEMRKNTDHIKIL